MQQAGTTGPGYPVCGEAEAEQRAREVVAEVGLDTDSGLDDRLTGILERWMDAPAARNLANEAHHLCRLLGPAPTRDRPDGPVDAGMLHRALVLAMTRPGGDECWQDYQGLLAAIEQYHQSTSTPGPLTRGWRKLTKREPDRAETKARAQPIIDARKHFTTTWRA